MAVLFVPPPDEVKYPTLGWQLREFIETKCVFGPGSLQGRPAKLDREKFGLLCSMYQLFPKGHRLEGRRRFQRCGLELRKGVAKTEFAAWVAFCELHPDAPVRFAGFDPAHYLMVDYEDGREKKPYFDGLAKGKGVESPYIPMMAVTEEQVEELAYGVLKYIVENSPDAHLFDISKERIVRLGATGSNEGEVVAVANAPGSRDGARTTFQHFDEPHRLFMPRMREAHETMLQNMPKRPLEDPWTFYTSTAGQPGQNSIEEDVRAEAEAIDKGEVEDPSLFFFARWAGEEHDDLSTVDKRIAAVSDATGDIGEWGVGQFERIAKDYDRKGVDRAYWERVWLNRWRKSGSQAFNMIKVNLLVRPKLVIPDGAFVGGGFDGARFRDSTALTVTDIQTGLQMMLGCWERPENVAEWEVPQDEVDDAFDEMMNRFEVWRAYCDPPYWEAPVAAWAAKYPDRVLEWHTQRKTPMAYACRAYDNAIESGEVTIADNVWRPTFIEHMGNAGRHYLTIVDDKGQPLWTMRKQDGRLEDKMDGAMSGCLSWQACIDARREGATPRPKTWMPSRIR